MYGKVYIVYVRVYIVYGKVYIVYIVYDSVP